MIHHGRLIAFLIVLDDDDGCMAGLSYGSGFYGVHKGLGNGADPGVLGVGRVSDGDRQKHC